jgi:NAD(P)-dependent dehydrogenase (short-subunit alcohol dehydrogenase family)
MPNKVFVVTGATSGIGEALAMDLAKKGETVVIVARDAERGNATLEKIRLATQNPYVDLQLCDLSILSSVRNLAEILKSKYEAIDVLINNASVYKRKRVITVDGFEEMFAANHLGPFLLTNLILEKLQAAVPASGSARVLNITAPSNTPLNFDDLQGEKNFSSLNTFGATKMANLLFTFELARRRPGSHGSEDEFRVGRRPDGQHSGADRRSHLPEGDQGPLRVGGEAEDDEFRPGVGQVRVCGEWDYAVGRALVPAAGERVSDLGGHPLGIAQNVRPHLPGNSHGGEHSPLVGDASCPCGSDASDGTASRRRPHERKISSGGSTDDLVHVCRPCSPSSGAGHI